MFHCSGFKQVGERNIQLFTLAKFRCEIGQPHGPDPFQNFPGWKGLVCHEQSLLTLLQKLSSALKSPELQQLKEETLHTTQTQKLQQSL